MRLRVEPGPCYKCATETERYIPFSVNGKLKHDYECLDCRRERVEEQVEAGLRPATDLLEVNLPENRGGRVVL